MPSPRLQSILKQIAAVVVVAGVVLGVDFVIHKPAGAACKSPSECRSRLCASAGYCSQRCTTDASCPAGYACRESQIYTNKFDLELAEAGVDKGGKVERLCQR